MFLVNFSEERQKRLEEECTVADETASNGECNILISFTFAHENKFQFYNDHFHIYPDPHTSWHWNVESNT